MIDLVMTRLNPVLDWTPIAHTPGFILTPIKTVADVVGHIPGIGLVPDIISTAIDAIQIYQAEENMNKIKGVIEKTKKRIVKEEKHYAEEAKASLKLSLKLQGVKEEYADLEADYFEMTEYGDPEDEGYEDDMEDLEDELEEKAEELEKAQRKYMEQREDEMEVLDELIELDETLEELKPQLEKAVKKYKDELDDLSIVGLVVKFVL